MPRTPARRVKPFPVLVAVAALGLGCATPDLAALRAEHAEALRDLESARRQQAVQQTEIARLRGKLGILAVAYDALDRELAQRDASDDSPLPAVGAPERAALP
ncbi:MAG: hypothetical protein MJE66_16960 [Proteobacteria bacterium]|nr:hypothetical protein [Pseudomonadota bacterium]